MGGLKGRESEGSHFLSFSNKDMLQLQNFWVPCSIDPTCVPQKHKVPLNSYGTPHNANGVYYVGRCIYAELYRSCGVVKNDETSHGPPERNKPMTQEENLHGDIPLHHNNDGLAGQLCAVVNWRYLSARSKLPTVLADRAAITGQWMGMSKWVKHKH